MISQKNINEMTEGEKWDEVFRLEKEMDEKAFKIRVLKEIDSQIREFIESKA